MALGVSAIIPGVSAGTLAVLMNIYDKLIYSISSIRKEFRKSVSFLLPILIGAALGIVILSFPINYAFKYFPLPTILFFGGLMVGTCPKLVKQGVDKGFNKKTDIACLILPAIFVVAICFIPSRSSADLSEKMLWYEYIELFLVGACAAGALIIPGISGSMLLLAFGYYDVILGTFSLIVSNPLHSLLVLAVFIVGVLIGFFLLAKFIKMLFNKFERATYWVIIGFVAGSLPALALTFISKYPDAGVDYVMVIIGIVCCVIGVLITLGIIKLFSWLEKRNAKAAADAAAALQTDSTDAPAGESEENNQI